MRELLTDAEQMVLLALVRLGDEAYGVSIQQAIEEQAGRRLSLAAVYGVLGRLEADRLVQAWLSEPLKERGGRARKHFRILPAGAAALREARAAMERMWSGLEQHRDLRAQ